MESYTTKFRQLILKCDLSELKENTIVRYLGGLRPTIGNVEQLQPYWILLDVQNLSFKVEK